MPISIACSNCNKNLKVPDAMAGKKIRCPACKSVVTVPAADDVESVDEEDAPPPKKKPATDAIKREPPRPVRKRRDEEDEDEDLDDRDEEDEEDEAPRRKKRRRDDDDLDVRRKRRAPHRAGTVLTLGIVSIFTAFCCPLIAWIVGGITLNMANADLAQMRSKKMDRAGMGNTNAGKICAIVGLVLGTINAIAGVVLKVMGIT